MPTAPLEKRVNVAVTGDMKARVLALADRQDRTESDVVRAALAAYLNKEENRGRRPATLRG